MKSDMLIQRPERQTPFQRGVSGTLTLVAWAVYAYLILPLLTLVLWALGLRNTYLQLWLPDSVPDPALLVTLPVIALACAALLIGWAEINRARFQNKERREQGASVEAADIAIALGATPTVATALRHARVATLAMDDAALVREVRVDMVVPVADPWLARELEALRPVPGRTDQTPA